jgi:hypothetical protein
MTEVMPCYKAVLEIRPVFKVPGGMREGTKADSSLTTPELKSVRGPFRSE